MGGGSGGGSQTVTQEFKPPEYTTNGSAGSTWQDYLRSASAIANTPYQQSGLPTVAPINDNQNTAFQLQYGKTLEGTPMSNYANAAFMNASAGNLANPFISNISDLAMGGYQNPAMGGYADMYQNSDNPALGGYAQLANSGSNPYTSDEYTNQMIADNTNNMANAYATGTAAQNDAAAAQSGAYGGSAHELQQQAGAANLAKQVGQMATGTRQQQQQYKGNMYNADFANRMGALGGYANTYQGDQAGRLAALGGLGGAYNSDIANQLGANAQAMGGWQNDVQNMLSGGALGLQGDAAYGKDIEGLLGAGNSQNNYYQKLLDQYNNQWNTENQYDANMNEYLGSVLGRASGSYGGTATTQPGQSPWAGLLGLGAGAAGLYSLFK